MTARFWVKVDKTGDCWAWTAARSRDGYGWFKVDDRMRQAHRVAYELAVGPIPEGLTIDHLCRNRACVNPAHLEAVTVRENIRRGGNASREKTNCPQGHPYDEANTYRWANGHRYCRACHRVRVHERTRRLRAARRETQCQA